MADFDINAHLQQMGFGRGKPGESKDPSNEETSLDYVTDKAALKAGTTVPELLGIDLQELGKAGIQRALGGDLDGITGKMIMPSALPDAQGGFLARLIHSIFIKNFHNITDNTGGTGGGGGGGDFAGGGGTGGGDFSGSGDFGGHAFSHPHFEDFIAPTPSFEWSAISWASLGALPRPAVPDMGPSAGVAIDH